jgi:hypothetical protein
MLKRFAARVILVSLVLALSSAAQQQERIDYDMITKIRYEGFRNSKVMEIASGLMDGIGPRLTGSPNMKRANDWTRDKLAEFGLANAHLEAWSPFGRGWSNEYVNVRRNRLTLSGDADYSPGPRCSASARVLGYRTVFLTR